MAVPGSTYNSRVGRIALDNLLCYMTKHFENAVLMTYNPSSTVALGDMFLVSGGFPNINLPDGRSSPGAPVGSLHKWTLAPFPASLATTFRDPNC